MTAPWALALLLCAPLVARGEGAARPAEPGPAATPKPAAQHLGPRVPAQIKRVVTLAPSLTELVLALGAGELLVGVTRFDDDPRVARVPRVGGYNDPEPESVLRQRPDLVLAQPAPENRGPVEVLGRLGIPVEAWALGTVEEITAAIEAVGARLGRVAEARRLTSELQQARETSRRETAAARKPRVLLVFGLEPLIVAGRGGFAGQLLEDAGGVNAVADQRPFSRLAAEEAAVSKPDVIVLCGIEEQPGRDAIPGLAQVRRARLASNALLRPGPRLVEALEDLRSALRPAVRPSGRREIETP